MIAIVTNYKIGSLVLIKVAVNYALFLEDFIRVQMHKY